jgi:hypothetical protein
MSEHPPIPNLVGSMADSFDIEHLWWNFYFHIREGVGVRITVDSSLAKSDAEAIRIAREVADDLGLTREKAPA